MKMLKIFALLFVASLTMVACGTSGQAVQNSEIEGSANQSLADILRKNSSLQVTGTGDNVKVQVRGVTSIKLNTQPLYVVDGMAMGNSYAQANNAINPAQITSIRVLRSQSDLTVYGENGNSGVILIKTKNGS